MTSSSASLSAAVPHAAGPAPTPRAQPATPFDLDAHDGSAATVDAYARAAGLENLWTRTAAAAAAAEAAQVPAPQRPLPEVRPPVRQPAGLWERLQATCSTALAASCATPARAALTSGGALLLSVTMAPGLGLTGTLMTLQTLAPYCAAAAALQWLTQTPDAAAATAARRQRRIAAAAIGLPVGGALGCILGAVAGATGGALLWAGAGGAAGVMGVLWLVSEAFESRLGLVVLTLMVLLALSRGL